MSEAFTLTLIRLITSPTWLLTFLISCWNYFHFPLCIFGSFFFTISDAILFRHGYFDGDIFIVEIAICQFLVKINTSPLAEFNPNICQ